MRLGTAAGPYRVYVFENHKANGGNLLTSQCYERVARGIFSITSPWRRSPACSTRSSGRLTVEPRPEEVGPLIEEAVAMLRPLAAGRSILRESAYDGDLPLVHFDSARVLQVISNRIGNAVKFTPAHGRICIRCEQAESEVQFSIADSGAGIPAEQLPHIFGSFWQASSTDRRGIGLGLSIAEGIVGAPGGRICVESEEGAGSTFFFTLPVAAAV